MKNKTVRKEIAFIAFFILVFSLNTIAQQDFLLSDSSMREYKLIFENNVSWLISSDSIINDVIEQIWQLSENDAYYIQYCKFNSEYDAIKGVAYNANSNAIPFVFGSSSGDVVGNLSWVSVDGSAMYFQKENIGIKIFKPLSFSKENVNNFLSISNKVIENLHIDVKIKDKETTSDISCEQFNKIIVNCDKLFKIDGYVEHKVEISKWPVTENSLTRGYRKQWSKKQSIFSIDAVLLADSLDTQKISECNSKILSSPICKIDNIESVYAAISEWQSKWRNVENMRFISIIGVKDNLLIHIYYYNDSGIDSKIIFKILKNLN